MKLRREPDLRGTVRIITPALSIARELWRYGEPELAERALRLSPNEVLDIGARAGNLIMTRAAASLWPEGPRGSEVLLATFEYLEGAARPASRVRRLPEHRLPQHLQATEEERWRAASVVSEVMTARHAKRGSPARWSAHRLLCQFLSGLKRMRWDMAGKRDQTDNSRKRSDEQVLNDLGDVEPGGDLGDVEPGGDRVRKPKTGTDKGHGDTRDTEGNE
jgi:hypothetical protein